MTPFKLPFKQVLKHFHYIRCWHASVPYCVFRIGIGILLYPRMDPLISLDFLNILGLI